MTDPKTRRFFLGAVTAAAASRVWGANDKINVGIVGIGGRGTNHLNTYSRMAGARVVGLCDVNQAAREVANATLLKNTGEKAKEFEDMRAMFADPSVEAVSIATPNHWHSLMTVWGCQAGKDVYVEKPISHEVWEGRKCVEAAEKYNRICQIGTQRQHEILDRVAAGRAAPGDAQRLHDVGWTMTDASLCGLGQTAASAVLSAMQLWPELFEAK